MKDDARDADLARLRAACGRHDVDLHASLAPPGSATWRINREAATLLGGGRALLLQVAHPLVAAGVGAHSAFREAPLRRLRRTLDLMLTVAFADAGAALRAVEAIERAHASVRGRLATAVGPFPAGTPYDAADPALLLWVHATLVDTALVAYEHFVAPPDARLRETYYEESKIVARLFRIPEARIPATFDAFRAYVHDMCNGPTLTVGPTGREIGASVLRPPLPAGVRHAFQATNLVTAALLPPRLRSQYELTWGPAREAAFGAFAATTRSVLPFLPALVRFVPQARRAA